MAALSFGARKKPGDLTPMELMQLEMFVAVVEEGSVHRAADKVCRTQPAVSIALKKLAIEVGSPLFHGKHRFDYQLTPTGEILYSYATRLLGLRMKLLQRFVSPGTARTTEKLDGNKGAT